MKAPIAAAMALIIAGTAVPAQSGSSPTFMLGVSFSFGGQASPQPGVTLNVLSSNRRDRFVGAAGVTWYPMSQGNQIGLGAGLGYTFNHGAVVMGYDFLNQQPQVSVGYARTKRRTAPPTRPMEPSVE
jgi:hypothetical protein